MSLNQEEKWLLEEKYDGVEGNDFQADLKRLAAGEPLGYVIGHVPFLGCQIHLDSRPLIPRPETEYWVEKATLEIQKAITTSPRPLRVLDLCAGSGCVGVAVAKHCPEVEVTFAEIDPHHLPTIQKNLKQNLPQYSNRLEYLKVVQSDLFENIPAGDFGFDFILSNPPYIDPAIDRAETSVKDHEPHLALYGGSGGMEIINRLIAKAPQYLAAEGQIWLEHEPEQVADIKKSAEASGFRATTFPDQYGVPRYSVLVLK